jgi:hypothetical protein
VDTLFRADLLAKRRNPGVRDERRVERVHALPWCVSCVSAASLSVSAKPQGGERVPCGEEVAYGCPKYSTERDCSAREDMNPSSNVSPATG